jgi:hypothetical protein
MEQNSHEILKTFKVAFLQILVPVHPVGSEEKCNVKFFLQANK